MQARAAAGAFIIGALFARSWPDSSDAMHMLDAARSLVDNGTLVTDPPSTYGVGQSLVMAPLYALGGVSGAMLSNAFAFAVIGWAVAGLAVRLAATRRDAWLTTVATMATPLLAYVANGFSELWVAACVACALLALHDRRPVLVGLAAGVACMFRFDSVLLLVPLLVLGAWREMGWRRLVPVGAGLLVPAMVVGWWNWVRFGSIGQAGYPGETFSHDFLAGVYGLLLSPGRGLLPYTPVVLVALLGWRAARQTSTLLGVVVGLLVVRVAFYASWWSWPGGISWGPRFLIPVLPGLIVLLVHVPARLRTIDLAPRLAACCLVVAGVVVAVAGAGVDYERTTVAMKYPATPSGSERMVRAHLNSEPYQDSVDRLLFSWGHFAPIEQVKLIVTGG